MLTKVKSISAVVERVSFDRFEKVEEVKVGKNGEYQDLLLKQIAILKKIYLSLPKECRYLIKDIEDISSYKAYIEAKIMYEQGLMDGIILSKIRGGAFIE